MLIVCQNCGTSYQIDAPALGPTGRSVRCVKCRHVWFAANTTAMAGIAQGFREDVKAGRADPAAEPASTAASLAAAPPSTAATNTETAAGAPGAAATHAAAVSPEMGIRVAADTLTGTLAAAEAANADAASEAGFPPGDPDTVVDAPPLAAAEPTENADIESAAWRRGRRASARRKRRGMPIAWTVVLALVAANLGLIAWRFEIVRWLPQTAPLYAALRLPVNLRGLVFADVSSTTETEDGVEVLVIAGTIASASAHATEVPRLRFSVRNAGGHEIYTWTALAAKAALAPGETLAFRSRLASPPHETHDVVVRFFNRRDLVVQF